VRFDQLAGQPESRCRWVESVALQKKELIETFPNASKEVKDMLEAIRKFALRKCLKPDNQAHQERKVAVKPKSSAGLLVPVVIGVLMTIGLGVLFLTNSKVQNQVGEANPINHPMIPETVIADNRKNSSSVNQSSRIVVEDKKDIISKKSDAPLLTEDQKNKSQSHNDDKFTSGSVWLNKGAVFTVTERNGDVFKATFKSRNGPGLDRLIVGKIKDGKVSWLKNDVQTTGGGKGSDNEGLIINDKMEMKWKDKNGKTQEFTLELQSGN
jgi:hypothetical protein